MSFESIVAKAQKAVRRVTGKRVTYTQNSNSVVIKKAAIGSKLHRVDDLVEGTAIRVISRDYLIAVSELRINNVLIEPQRGDEITDGTAIFRVIPAVDDEPCWEYSDTGRSTYRIHTAQSN